MQHAEGWSEWTPDTYDLARPPLLEATTDIDGGNDFPRQAKWASDGSAILSQAESGALHVLDPSFQNDVKKFPQAAPVLDFVWYPSAMKSNAASYCFVTSVRECPVKLIDAADGRLRASYRIVDHRERQIAPHSLCFDLSAQKLYCGFEDAIEVFDVSRPGEGSRIPTTPSKKSKDGLKGIVSALAFSSSFTGDESFFAAGSFTPTGDNIALFSDAQPQPLMYVGGGPHAGVTQVKFNPMRPHILYASYRGHANGQVYSWDTRSNLDSPLEIFGSPDPQQSRSNQRMRFDLDVAGRLLSIGDKGGGVSVFELDSAPTEFLDPIAFETRLCSPSVHFPAHKDVVGSVAFHPFESRLLTAAGSRHFIEEYSDSSEEDNDSRTSSRAQPVTLDSSVKIWDLRPRT